ncbi:hypothetical protein Tco_0982283 [Tanacetum coccineum]
MDEHGVLKHWYCYCDNERRNVKGKEKLFSDFLLIWYGNIKIDDTTRKRGMVKGKIRDINVDKSMKNAMPNEWILDSFENLIPIATPPAKSSYRLAPTKMKELSNQLQKLQDKGFIRPRCSPWGAPMLFMKNKDGSSRIRIVEASLDPFKLFSRLTSLKGSKIGKVDIDTHTMEQYLALTRANQTPGLVKPTIRNNVNFEIKCQFVRGLREETFSGNKNDDAHKHVEKGLDIISLFNIPGVTHDTVMLRVFPITHTLVQQRDSLTGYLQDQSTLWTCSKKPLSRGISHRPKPQNSLKKFITLSKKVMKHSIKLRKDTTTYQLLDSQGPIPGMTPARALNNLDSLRRDMKKLKENVHAIQVGCGIYEGAHLDKECPLNEEFKRVEEVKYGEFGRSFPKNGRNGARHSVGPTGYYTRMENYSPFGERKRSHINIRNQNATLNNLETYVAQLTKDFQANTAKEAPSSSALIGHCKEILLDNDAQSDEISSNETNELHGVSFIYDHNVEISLGIREDRILLDMNGNVHHPTIPIEKVYMTNSIQEEKYFNPLEICEDLFLYDSPLCLKFEKYNHPYDTNQNNEDTFVCDDIVQEPVTGRNGKTMMAEPGMVTGRLHSCKPIWIMGNGTCRFWPTCEPNLKKCYRGDSIYGMDKHGVLKHWFNTPKFHAAEYTTLGVNS